VVPEGGELDRLTLAARSWLLAAGCWAAHRLQQPPPAMLSLLSALATQMAVSHVPRGFTHLPINPNLGVPGFPDCVRDEVAIANGVAPELALNCSTGPSPDAGVISIGCIGDSITAGVHSTGGNHTYPGQLQIMLDEEAPGKYKVTNLGACGSTMLKAPIGNSPYWKRPQYKALNAGKWDKIIIMLGTNDAKDPGDRGPNNWRHDCGGPAAPKIEGCQYATDYASMISHVISLGVKLQDIHVAIPPPLMQHGTYGMNQTVINAVFPKLVPMIAKKAGVPSAAIDVYHGMGGTASWASDFPPSCKLGSAFKPCAWWCDKQSCDQCHPNNDGYTQMATIMKKGLGI
jgi:lysophospholipase L1-like esterase